MWPVRAALVFVLAAASLDSAFAPVQDALKNGKPALARELAIRIATAIVDAATGEESRQPLQRAALFRAHAERATLHFAEAEWYWWMAKELSVSDEEMTIAGLPPMTFSHRQAEGAPGRGQRKKQITPPRIVSRVAPSYPAAARKLGIERDIVIEAIIDRSGVVHAPHVISKGREPELEYAAMDVLSTWRFEPGLLDGKPVPVIYRLTIRFRLADD